jgi:hypothetical protein
MLPILSMNTCQSLLRIHVTSPTVGEGGGDMDGLGPRAIYDSDGETLEAAGIRPTDNRRPQSIFNQNTSVACSVGNQHVC